MRVYVTRRIPETGIKVLKEKDVELVFWDSDDAIPHEELVKNIQNNFDGLYCMLTDSIDSEVLDAAGPRLKAVCTMSVGYDHMDLEEMKNRSIIAANCSTVSSDCVSEFAVGLVLASSRRIVESNRAVIDGQWKTWKPMWLLGFELNGKTVGILGLGRIGFGIAQRLNAFKIGKMIYHDVVRVNYDKQVGAEFVDFDRLLRESDVICISCNLTDRTKGLFNADTFAKMKKTAILVNISRGGIVNHDDLLKALKEKQISCAALDVTEPEPLPADHPLTLLENCIVTPHVGSSTLEARNAMSEVAATNMLDILLGNEPTGLIRV